jgi:hypothetical protein
MYNKEFRIVFRTFFTAYTHGGCIISCAVANYGLNLVALCRYCFVYCLRRPAIHNNDIVKQ